MPIDVENTERSHDEQDLLSDPAREAITAAEDIDDSTVEEPFYDYTDDLDDEVVE